MTCRFICLAGILALAFAVAMPASARAQDAPAEHQHADTDHAESWMWMADGNVFFGSNYQQRFFYNFNTWESQNWFMLTGERTLGAGRLSVQGMVSLEPFTLHAQGSPQLFQTGESYQHIPLVNYQHPHDLLMGLGATYRIQRAHSAYFIGADLVGSPTLGPTPFMHRESARDNPQVPLTHHYLDSTHITPGVVRAGVDLGPFTFESSVFRGAEPDEDRTNIERPRLDSWAARVGWHHGPWQAQFSGGHLRQPEWFDPYDLTRYTASIGFDGHVGSRPLTATVAWGGNREFNGFNGNADGYLAEWDFRATSASTLYGRTEVADKEPFGLGDDLTGFPHRHFLYKIAAVTFGYLRDLSVSQWGRFGVGADATAYHMPAELFPYWEGSHSFHVFVRWRPQAAMMHMH